MTQIANNMSITNGIVFDPIIPCIDHDGDQVRSTTKTHDDIMLEEATSEDSRGIDH
jgi:hypothetical protein